MTWQRDESHAPLRIRGSGPNGGASENATRRSGRQVTPRPLISVHPKSGPNREHEGYLIKELQHRLRTKIEARIRAKGLWLSFPHSAILMALNEEPGLSGAQLARRNSVTAQTMNGLLQPLESKGFIERRADPENARVLKCYLKPKGAQVWQQVMTEAGAVFDLMLGKLTSRERAEFRRILQLCIAALHTEVEEVAAVEGGAKRRTKC